MFAFFFGLPASEKCELSFGIFSGLPACEKWEFSFGIFFRLPACEKWQPASEKCELSFGLFFFGFPASEKYELSFGKHYNPKLSQKFSEFFTSIPKFYSKFIWSFLFHPEFIWIPKNFQYISHQLTRSVYSDQCELETRIHACCNIFALTSWADLSWLGTPWFGLML